MIWLIPIVIGGGLLLSNKKVQAKVQEALGPFMLMGPVPQSNIDNTALAIAKRDLEISEGRRRDVYTDHLGYLTVGIGHKVLPTDGLKKGDVITDARVDEFFAEDVQIALRAARSQAIELQKYTPSFLAALIEVNFQLGTGWKTKFANTYNLLKGGNAQQAIRNLQQSLWAKQTPVRVANFVSAIREAYA